MNFVRTILEKIKGKNQDKNIVMYYSYYLFGLSNGNPIWTWENWKKCMLLLQPIIDLSPEIPFIKTSQSIPVSYGKGDKNVSYDKGSLGFGKMVWNEKNNEKWTTKYANEEHWTFFDTEVAFPTRSHCHKNGGNPEIFITIQNQNLTGNHNPKIDQAISIHIRTTLITADKLISLEENIHKIGSLLNWKIAGKIKRQTSYKSNIGIGYTDSFWDGTYGVLATGGKDFSDNYKRYGIQEIEIGSS